MKWFKKRVEEEEEEFKLPSHPLLIAVDFDGTCVEKAYPDIGKTKAGAVETLKALVLRDHKLILWTCREDCEERNYLAEAVAWFEENGIEVAGINQTPEDIDFRKGGGRKAYADVYIDDSIIGGFPGWARIHYQFTGQPLII
ncbi:MAG: hydrolase [Lentisphaeria bacterium]|nr:hydrolase [Lentisphaeria bacterium]NQZ67509.1 hydrolase [Lentisphaeria bacterium]